MPSTHKTTEPQLEVEQNAAAANEATTHAPPVLVGIGTSAGGLEALETLFTHLPTDTGLAFAVVQHLDPTHESVLADILAKYTPMAVKQVTDAVLVEPNHVYVIAPNRYMALHDGVIHTMKPSTARGMRLPIDHFSRSLAEDLGDQAIGIVLSGTGTDGCVGLKAIKEHGGLTVSQAPGSARFDTMPRNAIQTGMVDVVATADQMATHLVNYLKRASSVPSTETGERLRSTDGDAVQRILTCLREHTGHDFDGYKKNTIARRIERRMTLNRIEPLDDYIHFLETQPVEADALFRELLIGVTSFFRDPEAFAHLDKTAIAPLFMAHREPWRPIRVWVPGCSTGEEAYSVAILLNEHAERTRKRVEFQIFATDIDQVALDKGRSGRYPTSIAADMDAERLQKYFIRKKDGHSLLVGRQLRDSVVFAAQSVIKDPPFSKLDLICCRNLMIYLGSALQQKLLPILHYALNPGGFLFLGNSETLGSSQHLFRTLDQKWKIFQRREIGSDLKQMMQLGRANTTKPITPAVQSPDRQLSLRELTEQTLLEEYTPTAIVVNSNGDMLYVHGRTGKFLEQTTGDVSTNILKVARDGLRMPLTAALHNVNIHKKPLQVDGISIGNGKDVIRIQLTVAPIAKPTLTQGMMLVTLTEVPSSSSPVEEPHDGAPQSSDEQRSRNDALERELSSTRQYLQTTIEELETTNEELKSANEELQSSNEELQSINEELQTSKEELQSVNEELNTLNIDLQNKINDLVDANNDIKNLLDNAQIGVIFLDAKLRIRRFTRAATEIVDLIAADIGRPLSQFVHRLRHERLLDDAHDVLDTRQTKEMEVRAVDNRWYLARILPYRTLDDNVDGVVLTFTDVTQLKDSKEKLEFLFDVLPIGISVLNRERKSYKYNAAFLRIADLTADEFARLAHLRRSYIRPDGTERKLEEFAASRVLAGEASVLNVESGFVRRNGDVAWMDASAMACPFADWGVVVVTTDITARKEAELALLASEEKFSKAFHLAPLMLAISDAKTGRLIECNQQFLDVSGYTRDEVIGKTKVEIGWLPAEARARIVDMLVKHGHVRNEEFVCRSKDGRMHDCLYNGFTINVGGQSQLVSMAHDISERKRSEEAIKATLRHEKETVLRELAHRTKNNMFVIRSILNLHAMHTQNEEVRRLFADVENKIVAMALVHQKLYQSKNLSRLDLGEYLRDLTPALMESHSFTPGRISFDIEADSISALIDTAIPCGLVVTELVSNAFKHAFPDSRTGTISIRFFRQSPNTIHLVVRDDGVGVPESFDFHNQSTLGLETIFMIVEHQLKGTVRFESSPEGLICLIEFADIFYSERV